MYHEFINNKRLARFAAASLEDKGLRLYRHQALYKELCSSITPTQADQYFWAQGSAHTIAVWISLQAVTHEMGQLGFDAQSQSVEFDLDRGIPDESEEKINATMVGHGFEFVTSLFNVGKIGFHLDCPHDAKANLSPLPKPVMTIVCREEQMKLQAAPTPIQANDAAHWCPSVFLAELTNSADNLC